MTLPKKVKKTLKKLISVSGYRKPIRSLINNSSVSTTIETGNKVKIDPWCEISGDIRLADHVHIGSHSILNGDICIGKRTNLNRQNELYGKVNIGKYCAIAPRVTFRQHNHVMHKPSLQGAFYKDVLNDDLENTGKGPIEIGNDVWLGAGSTILSGVTIGDGAVIGAGSIVTKDIEPYSVAVGVPTTHKKWRFSEGIREELLEIEWWNWSEQEMKRNKEFFQTDLTDIESVYDIVDR